MANRVLMLISMLLLVLPPKTLHCNAMMLKSNDVVIANYRRDYDNENRQEKLQHGKAAEFRFRRFQSPAAIKKALAASRGSPFRIHQGKDGRKGHISCNRLGGDWVLAESEQVAVKCTTEDVLCAYLSGDLQQRWNAKEVLQCKIKRARGKRLNKFGGCYQQDLVLHSQRIIRSHTGVMRYSQIITIDKIGDENYCVSIRLDPEQQQSDATARKPFDSLSVYVGLQQNGDDVNIYAAGVMQVNRKVRTL